MVTYAHTVEVDTVKIATDVNDHVGQDVETDESVTEWLRANDALLPGLLHEAIVSFISSSYP